VDRNTVLAFALSMLVFTTWLLWKAQTQPPPLPPGEEIVSTEVAPPEPVTPAIPSPVDQQAFPPHVTEPVASVPAATAEATVKVASWNREFDSELYRARLSNRGASLSSWMLAEYTERTPHGEIPVELVPGEGAGLPVLSTPMQELGLGDLARANWEVEAEGEDGASFVARGNGLTVRKTYEFERDSYVFRVALEVENQGDRVVSPRFEVLWPAALREGEDFKQHSLMLLRAGKVTRELVSGLGGAGFLKGLFSGGGSDEPPVYRGDIDWAGIDDKYFLGVLFPDRPQDAVVSIQPIEKGESGVLVLGFGATELPPGHSVRHELRGYIGPKLPEELGQVNETLQLSINRGWSWLTPLTRFFEWMLHACYTIVPNYGIAIIILTILVRLVTIPIMGRQMKSMERMREVQPKLKELQAQHGDDRQKQSEEMMKLYKREGVNPLGGCLPMLLQFPVFIGLFYALQSSFDLRHANFFGWITDLSAPESLFVIPGLDIPFRVLPLIMGASMILQQKITPTTVDPAQARMMMTIMPIMFTVLFYQFPSGLVLYWMISNLLGIAHQLLVGRRMRAAKGAKG
jgi:YidC/Oxa1 family membrane protein insertase